MIVCVGELLADMVGKKEEDALRFDAYCGGAPFNVAVNAKQAGAKVGFICRVGKDVIGRFLETEAAKANFDKLVLQKDENRNTTLAFVTLTDGERDFAFNRHDTADFNIDYDAIDWGAFKDLSIIHLGSLMLSEKSGVEFAQKIVAKAKEAGVLLSFDLNFRKDIYKDFASAVKTYKPFVESADIVKFSEEEVSEYTGIPDMINAIESFYRKDTLVLVTLGKKGCFYYYNGKTGTVTENVFSGKLVDTTGAGDAFFGTFLANIEGKTLDAVTIEKAIAKANLKGGQTTQFFGAVKL